MMKGQPSSGAPNGGSQAGRENGACDARPALAALTARVQAYAAERRWSEAQAALRLALRRFYEGYAAGEAEADDLARIVAALAALEEDERLYRLYRRCVRGTLRVQDEAVLAHLGVAAFNLGRYVEARWLWRSARRLGGSLGHVLDALLFTVDAVEAGRVPELTLDHRLRPEDMPAEDEDLPAYVKALAVQELWSAGGDAREAALDILAQADEAWAVDFLFGVLLQPELPDRLKLKAAVWLLERGFIDKGEPVAVHLEGRLQQMRVERARGGQGEAMAGGPDDAALDP